MGSTFNDVWVTSVRREYERYNFISRSECSNPVLFLYSNRYRRIVSPQSEFNSGLRSQSREEQSPNISNISMRNSNSNSNSSISGCISPSRSSRHTSTSAGGISTIRSNDNVARTSNSPSPSALQRYWVSTGLVLS